MNLVKEAKQNATTKRIIRFPLFEDVEQYKLAFQESDVLMELARDPFFLRILLTILP